MLNHLNLWQKQGWISALDWAFARFLADRAPECSDGVLLAAALASRQVAQGHVCLDLAAVLAEPDRGWPTCDEAPIFRPSHLLAGKTPASWCEELAQVPDVVAQRSPLYMPEEQSDGAPLVLVRTPQHARLYLARYWRCEQQVASHIQQRLSMTLPVPTHLPAMLARLFPQTPSLPPVTDWQKLACALAARSALTLITGGPGTGKTTTVIRLLALLQEAVLAEGRPALRIRLAAPTGKAAARLTASIAGQIAALPVDESVRTAIPAEVSTLHRLLGSRPNTRHFRHDRQHPLSLDVLVVDEASMIDLEMMASLLEALPLHARLILLGDKDQLASVEAGAVLGDLCLDAERGHYSPATLDWLAQQCGTPPTAPALQPGDERRHALAQQTVMLRHSHRFQAESGIGQFAQAVNRGDVSACLKQLAAAHPGDSLSSLLIAKEAPGTGKAWADFILSGRSAASGKEDACVGYSHYLQVLRRQRPTEAQAQSAWHDWAQAVLTAFGRFQLLTALREGEWGVTGLNPRIAHVLHQAGWLEDEERRHGHWYEGRPVLVTRNDYSLGVMNGDVGICLRVPNAGKGMADLRVAFPHPEHVGQVRFLHPSRLNAVETAFAMTVHKSQGSEFSHAALVLPERGNPVLTRELLYTAVTRARDSFTLLLHHEGVLRDSIHRRVERDSGLRDLLWP